MTQALDDEDMSVSDVSSGSSKASSGARSDSADLPVRILLVEDDALTQKIVTRLLSSLNFEVTTASNGCDAFALLKKARKQRLKFDAILTDEKMPHMTGTGLAKLLTASSEWRRIPVFLMSSEVTEAMRLEAVHTGIVKVFSKPITSQTLQGVWRNVLHRRSNRHSRHLTETKSAAKQDTRTDYQSSPDEARSPTVKREHAAEEPKAKKPRTILLSSPGSQATNPDNADDKHGEDACEEDMEKPVRASSLVPSKTFSGTYDIRAYSLPAPLLVKDFLPASIIPGPKLEVSELDIKPLNINAGIFPFSSLAQERQRLNIKTGLKNADPRVSEGEGSQVAASLCQLHHSTNNSAFQTFDSSGSGSVLQMLSNKQTTPVAASPTLRAPSFKIPPEIMHAHQGKVSDAFQAAAQQQKQADVCAANRKAAILRFKAKRQQRSFEKKVRYASRKRLAEQRPRIKGQFVKAADLQAYKAGTLT